MLEVKRKPVSPTGSSLNHDGTDRGAGAQRLRAYPTSASQNRMPVITGEIHFKGEASVQGIVTGQFGSGKSSNLKQKSSAMPVQPELNGEISFKDMIRVNGHIAGTVFSESGTLIVDSGAHVEANVNVAVAVISGSVTGDIVARDRVELGPASKICGNISTRSISIKNGAIFEGVCRMIQDVKVS